MKKRNSIKELSRRVALIVDKSRPKGAKGRSAIKRDRKQALAKGVKPSDLIFKW